MGLRSSFSIPSNLSEWLDAARGLAAIEVLAFHSYQLMFLERTPSPNNGVMISSFYSVVWTLSAHGVSAVMVFFVLSGYLVGGPALVRACNGQLNAIDYFAARGARLYVVVLPALVTSYLAYVLARHLPGWTDFVASRQNLDDAPKLFSSSASPVIAVCNLAFLETIACPEFAGNVAWWSLSNEFWYYVLIFAIVSLRRIPALSLLIIAVLALFVLAERNDTSGTHVGLQFFVYFGIWSFGAIAFALVAPPLVWFGGFVACLGAIYFASTHGILPHWLVPYVVIGLSTAVAIVALERTAFALPSFLSFTKELAKISFSLYATHYPLLVLLNVMFSSTLAPFSLTSLGLNAAFMMYCLVVSYAFYFYFERHTAAARLWLLKSMGRGSAVLGRRAGEISAQESMPEGIVESAVEKYARVDSNRTNENDAV